MSKEIFAKAAEIFFSPLFMSVAIRLDKNYGEIRNATTLRRGRDVYTNESGAPVDLAEDGLTAVVPHDGDGLIEIRSNKREIVELEVEDHREFFLDGKFNRGWAEITERNGDRHIINEGKPVQKLLKGKVAFAYLRAQPPKKE